MQKILEYKKEDWSKGLSAQSFLAVGGLFQNLKNIDPFYNQGLATPSLTPTSITPTSSAKFITNFLSSGVAYTYLHSDTELIQVTKDSPYTQVDKSSEITFSGGLPVIGAIIWKGKYIYARASGDLRANSIPVASGNDVQLKSGFNSTFDSMPLCIGGDGNLYHGDNSRVGIITSATGTSGNSNTFNIDSNFNVRDLINNGQYLVIIADNNSNPATGSTDSRVVGNYRCRVYFWDMIKAVADVIYDVDDSYLIAGQQLDGNIYFFGYNGLYVCNIATPPKMVRPFVGFNGVSRGKPKNSYQLVKSKGSIYWIDGFDSPLTNGRIFAYGNPTSGLTKIFYEPYNFTNSTDLQNVIQVVGEQFWVGIDTPSVVINNVGTTRGTSTISTLDETFDQLMKLESVKVVLAQPLETGQSVTCQVVGANGSKTLSDNETKSYNSSNPKQILDFKIKPVAGSMNQFENMRVNLTVVGASVQRLAVIATPVGDDGEQI